MLDAVHVPVLRSTVHVLQSYLTLTLKPRPTGIHDQSTTELSIVISLFLKLRVGSWAFVPRVARAGCPGVTVAHE